MKKVILSLMIPALLGALTSCDKNTQKVKEFADEFATNVKANNLEKIRSVYPDAELADSVAFSTPAGDPSVKSAENDGEYMVTFSDDAGMLVKVADDGTVSVINSVGIFAYPADLYSVAEKTGALSEDMKDVELAKVMLNINPMLSYLCEEYNTTRKDALRLGQPVVTKDITYAMEEGRGYYVITNELDEPIAGEDYTITWEDVYLGFGYDSQKNRTTKGKDIAAKGTVQIPFVFSGHGGESIVKVAVNAIDENEFIKHFKPKGDEYAKYVKNHGAIEKREKGIGDGPFTFAGKLGGKYPIHLTIDKGFKTGSYYYDKYGPSHPLKLTVTSYEPSTGKLKLEEFTDKGRVTGEFAGIVTAETYEGEMDAYTGKTHKFTLTAVN